MWQISSIALVVASVLCALDCADFGALMVDCVLTSMDTSLSNVYDSFSRGDPIIDSSRSVRLIWRESILDADAAAIFVTVLKEGVAACCVAGCWLLAASSFWLLPAACCCCWLGSRHEDCVIIISSKDSDNTISDAENALRQIASLILKVAAAGYDRLAVADHASNLASKIRSNLTNSMKALGVDILTGVGTILGPQKVKYGADNVITAKDIIIATGSVPLVPKGIEVDGKTVITSDHALKLESVPEWIAIVESGCIGLEFSDLYTALGSEVTFVEALDQLVPGFDPEIGKLAQRVLVNPRKIDYHTGVFASKITPAKDGKPVMIELIDAKTKEPKDTFEASCKHLVDAAFIATERAPHTKGLGLENPQAREKAEKEGFEVSVAKSSFKANTKALAENEGEGLAKLIYKPDNGEILGVHIFGFHVADLIHEASNAIAQGTRIQPLGSSLSGPSGLSPPPKILQGNTMTNSIVEVFKQAAVHLQDDLLNVLKSKDFHDHESMILEACFIFCALDALFVDSQPFKEQAEEFIGCAT
ncbi:hypothetical protein LOK49_LG02G00429 [Camellia lanceoleosa]|uniref:Uncharacterized protein n=1 Tax=Camellia lanceoleosa TaxID=1840588 RepID=A0ACC0IP15_9ERIC|nr:hypothetical protein LOK49_LG02G00429 [Camellia lanceoleosa]